MIIFNSIRNCYADLPEKGFVNKIVITPYQRELNVGKQRDEIAEVMPVAVKSAMKKVAEKIYFVGLYLKEELFQVEVIGCLRLCWYGYAFFSKMACFSQVHICNN